MVQCFLSEIGSKTVFTEGQPAQPFEQLLSVLPSKNVLLLPEPLRHFMTSSSSPLLDYYTSKVKIDREGEKFKSDYLIMAPFIDPKK